MNYSIQHGLTSFTKFFEYIFNSPHSKNKYEQLFNNFYYYIYFHCNTYEKRNNIQPHATKYDIICPLMGKSILEPCNIFDNCK